MATNPDQLARRRIRSLRKANGFSLEELAGRAHIDKSTLSRIETGARRLDVEQLAVLATALGTSPARLLSEEPDRDPRVKGNPRRYGDMTTWPLSASTDEQAPNVHKIHISASRNKPPAELPVHEGREWIYVIAGRMRLILGDNETVVEPGEAVDFSTWTPHWFGAVDTAVEAIGIFNAQGEKMHLRD